LTGGSAEESQPHNGFKVEVAEIPSRSPPPKKEEETMFEETSRAFGGLTDLWEESTREVDIVDAGASITDTGPQKILLPRGSAETRFAPRQYYYLASRSGVMPSWAIAAPGQSSSRGLS
jgi:hypothetical protein